MPRKKLASQAPKVRVDQEMHKRVDQLAEREKITQVGIVQTALEEFFRRREKEDFDISLTPTEDHEKALVRAVLKMARNPRSKLQRMYAGVDGYDSSILAALEILPAEDK